MAKDAHMTTELAAVDPWNEGSPEIHGPRIFGASVGVSFFFPVPATGERPLSFSADGLPDGLTIDAASGVISGSLKTEGETDVAIKVSNALGNNERKMRVVAGGRLALTPPLGWNSWNVWARNMREPHIRDAAEAMVSAGLAAHGYSYVNIDDCWQGERGGPYNGIQQNDRFGDMKALCDHIHSLGLRVGIYSTPWTISYAGYPGGSSGEVKKVHKSRSVESGKFIGVVSHAMDDARQWAEWGIDYLKYDWNPWDVEEVELMADALKTCGRDIVYSLSNSAPFEQADEWARLAHVWRTTGDIRDTWESVSKIGFPQDPWTPFGGPGHWNDPDMLVVGKLGWGEARDNRMTHDEQITHITLWALLASPFLLGCDLAQMDAFTINLMCNDEMLDVLQDPLGKQGHCLHEDRITDRQGQVVKHTSIYERELGDGSVAVGFFNRGPSAEVVEVTLADIGLKGECRVRDIWARKDRGTHAGTFAMGVPSHGAQFVRIC